MSESAVPVVDIAPFLSGDGAEKVAVAKAVDEACRRIGFLIVAGHGVPPAVVDDCLAATWAFFDLDDALDEQRRLEEEGFDTWLRPTSAFSTLGWFADPLMSTVLRQDEIGVVQTILHEVSHAHLWVSGHVDFNESFATFVGDAGAAAFFCADSGEIPTVRCTRARRRWGDAMKFSVFLDGLVADLERVYGDGSLDREERLAARERIFAEALDRFADEVQPSLEASTYAGFAATPLNNATLLARMRYYHRLPDFQALLDRHGGDLRSALAEIKAGVEEAGDPFEVLGERR